MTLIPVSEKNIKLAIEKKWIVEDIYGDFCIPTEYDAKRQVVWGIWYKDISLTILHDSTDNHEQSTGISTIKKYMLKSLK